MKTILTIILLSTSAISIQAQTAAEILSSIRSDFKAIHDLKCKVEMEFDIPGVSLDRISGKMFYKKPDKFRVHTKGLIFLPRQNPFQQLETLEDPEKYMAVLAGESNVNGIDCHVVNVIPNDQGDLVMMRMEIGKQDGRIHKTELTLKREGTVTYFNEYDDNSGIIPSEVRFQADFRKFKMPKAISGDFSASVPAEDDENGNSDNYETGNVTMRLTDLELNRKIDDRVFEDDEG